MAMFPNATRGYMPFVSGQAQKRQHGQSTKSKSQKGRRKTYQVTLRDRNGFTYTYIVQTDGSKSMPVLCDSKVKRDGLEGLTGTMSLPDIGKRSKNESLESSKKEGLLAAFLRFLSGKKSPKSKSKRKQKPMIQRKRQRTVSMMSNLDPIQESPDEDDFEDDNDSYTHETISVADSDDSENVSFHSVNDDDETDDEEENEEIVKVEP